MDVRQRKGKGGKPGNIVKINETDDSMPASTISYLRAQPLWVVLAVGSGMCAAINGVFAKLTTTSLTSSFSSQLSTLLGLAPDNSTVNVLLRGSFFGLNLLFNAIMWGLFTAALTKGDSTTRVSIVNVSANFFVTAMLGWAIFSEKLPLLWWLGAALLACGNVIIGRREETEKPGGSASLPRSSNDAESVDGLLAGGGQAEEDLIELDEPAGALRKTSKEDRHDTRVGEEIDAPI